MEPVAILIADADEFARDLQESNSLYPIDILRTQKETQSILEILLELNIDLQVETLVIKYINLLL